MSKTIDLFLIILLLAIATTASGHGGPLSAFTDDPLLVTSAKEIGADDTQFTKNMLTPQPGDTGVYGDGNGPSPIAAKNLGPIIDHGVDGRKTEWKYGDECGVSDGAMVRVIGVHQDQVLVEILSNTEGMLPLLDIPPRPLCPDSIIFFMPTFQFQQMQLRWLRTVEQRKATEDAAAEKILAEQKWLDKQAQALAAEKQLVRDLLAQRDRK